MNWRDDLVYFCRPVDYYKTVEYPMWPVGRENWPTMKILFGRDWVTFEEAELMCRLYYNKVVMGRPFWVRWKNRGKPIPVEEARKLLARK